MNRLFLLLVTVILVLSGCGLKDQPSAVKSQPGMQEEVQAAAAEPAAVTTPDITRPKEAETKLGPGPGNVGQAKPEVTSPVAKQPEAVAAISQTVVPPMTANASGSAAMAEQTQQPPKTSPEPEPDAITISITGDKKHGVILKEISVPFRKGTTVMDALKQATKDNKIQMEYNGKGTYAYVQGIDNLYEFDGGPKSGWVYKVNGLAPSEGAGSYKTTAGDKIEWLYTLNLGEDVGAKMK
ncbi:DUF4430 domain-containing protein [Paenibacillus frigoriresistens]|uniref:DUF4430 domain-containing protein n=1 Tax=Paenibacillus alginolyticus TaxID=59839 RepID=UPI00156412CB|nr:DUF4430 domain-containing protein [Paenibacillus frigoriresistens]NRF96244.1 DUF4430 domain-containing protein [Paenibacillus frigoriresistens]